MQNFMLDENGDVIIKGGEIQLVSGNELLLQKVKTVLGTNKKEWFLNPDEGITFSNILKKSPNMDIVRNEVLSALIQVDDTFYMTEFNYEVVGRTLKIHFVAKNSNDEIVIGDYTF